VIPHGFSAVLMKGPRKYLGLRRLDFALARSRRWSGGAQRT
jgi:hypothetical protein